MSIDITLSGSFRTLLSHMAMLGAATILDEELGAGSALCRWTDEADPSPVLRVPLSTEEEVGQILLEHARRHATTEIPWMHTSHPVLQSLFAARAKAPSTDGEWHEFTELRTAVSDDLRGLESEMTLGLGERAWWLSSSKTLRPDHGASAWEMRTRNKGMEVIAHALRPTLEALAQRDARQITSGLTGGTLDDEVSGNKRDSRTGLGLGPLGPTDTARAWCALWGIASLPVWHRASNRSVTAAHVPGKQSRRAELLLPVPTRWVTVARWRAALRSGALTEVGKADSSTPEGALNNATAARELAEWGFVLLLRFPVNVSGSTSAPERRALDGEVIS